MPNVLIRDVPEDDLAEIRSAAEARGTSLQGYLVDAVHAQAVYLRRRAAVLAVAERLAGGRGVPEEERRAVLAAIDEAHEERAAELSAQPRG